LFGSAVILTAVLFSGCTDTQEINQNSNVGKFIGTWNGDLEISSFGGRNNGHITQLTFMGDIVYATLTSDREEYAMNYTYTIDGNNLVLQPKFDGRGGFGGRQSFNGTLPWNNTQPWNGTRPPINGTWPSNGTQPPNGWRQQPPSGERPSMSMSFVYSFNEAYDVLYLDGSQFKKF
jgi:hypothetical protein